MLKKIFLYAALLVPLQVRSQEDTLVLQAPSVLDLQFLVVEAMMNNPEIKAELDQMNIADARVPQAGSLDYPELKFMQEAMPGFDFNQAMFSRLELMQSIPFPTKLTTKRELASIQAEHAHHDHLEKINEVLARLKSAFYELWLAQQNTILDQENARLLSQFVSIARTRYGVAEAPFQDVLKGQVELDMVNNDLISWHQHEFSAKAMLMSILNRSPKDTISSVVISEDVVFDAQLDTLLAVAMQLRPMIIHDSLSISENRTMLSLAKQNYIPDVKLGLERITSPLSGFSGWSVSATLSLPFAPWTLGKNSAQVEEAEASIDKAQSSYIADRNMVVSNIKDLYYKANAGKQKLDVYRTGILPRAHQALDASLSAYQTGKTDFLMLIDSYRTFVNLTKEYFMIRMQFEQNKANLEREVGTQNLSSVR